MSGTDRKPLEGDDYVFPAEFPGWVPAFLAQWLADLTYDEWHAFKIGFATATLALTVGRVSLLAAAAVALFSVVYGFRKRRPDGIRPFLLDEIWYWSAGAVLGIPAGIGGSLLVGIL